MLEVVHDLQLGAEADGRSSVAEEVLLGPWADDLGVDPHIEYERAARFLAPSDKRSQVLLGAHDGAVQSE